MYSQYIQPEVRSDVPAIYSIHTCTVTQTSVNGLHVGPVLPSGYSRATLRAETNRMLASYELTDSYVQIGLHSLQPCTFCVMIPY